jgi:DNA-binding response OmpR family regulator
MRDFRILIVEDDIRQSEPFRKLFEREDYEVIVEPSASSALSWLETHEPHLALVDVNLEEPNSGYRVMAALAKKHIMAIVMTSRSNVPQEERAALSSGAVTFMRKPLDHRNLMSTVENLLDNAFPMHRQKDQSVEALYVYDRVYLEPKSYTLVDETVNPPVSVSVRQKHFKILMMFATYGSAEREVTRADIIRDVWGGTASENSLYTEISRVNSILQNAGTKLRIVNTNRSNNPEQSKYELKLED